MREYLIPLYDEWTEEPIGTLKLRAANYLDMDAEACWWMDQHPGCMADTFRATSQPIEVKFLGEIEL